MAEASIRLRRGEGRSFKAGGPWIYDNEIGEVLGDPADGDVVAIEDYNGSPGCRLSQPGLHHRGAGPVPEAGHRY